MKTRLVVLIFLFSFLSANSTTQGAVGQGDTGTVSQTHVTLFSDTLLTASDSLQAVMICGKSNTVYLKSDSASRNTVTTRVGGKINSNRIAINGKENSVTINQNNTGSKVTVTQNGTGNQVNISQSDQNTEK